MYTYFVLLVSSFPSGSKENRECVLLIITGDFFTSIEEEEEDKEEEEEDDIPRDLTPPTGECLFPPM